MNQTKSPVLPALARIVGISCCLWAALLGAWWWHQRRRERLEQDPRFIVTRVAARPVTQDRLPLAVLSELLHLDTGTPTSLFSISPKMMRQRLVTFPAIRQARVWRLAPGTVGIEYALRSPVATIAGLKNVAIDEWATAFFLFPCYAPKHLPTLVLPVGEVFTLREAQKRLYEMKETKIAMKLLEMANETAKPRNMTVELVDLSLLRQQSLFRRELVLGFSSLLSKDGRLYVRMESRNILPMMELLPKLFDRLMSGTFRGGVLDLRYGQMAILSGEISQYGQRVM